MPQMMPINWLISFFFFLCIYLIFNILNYYNMNFNLNNKKFYSKTFKKNLNWKW